MVTSMRVLGVLMMLVIVSGCVNNSQEDEDTTLQVPVGERAWGEAETVNISNSLDPAEVSLTKSETLVWVNKNNFNTKVSIQGSSKEFTILPEEKQSFKSSSDFSYRVSSEEGSIGTGKVTLE